VNEKPPLNYALAFGWTLGAAACLLWLASLGMMIRPSAATDLVQIGAIEALVFLLGILGVLGLHGREGPLSATLGVRPTHPALLLLGLALGIAARFPAEGVDSVVGHFFPQKAEDLAAESALFAASSPVRLVLVLLVVACVGPLVEELFFRGALFGALRQHHSLLGSTIVTATCFVVGHLNVRHWPALTIVALILSHLRAVGGSLLPSLAMHVAFNAVTVLAFFRSDARASSQSLGLVPVIVGTVATMMLVLIVQGVSFRVEAARAGRVEDAG
jgi:membrane protease YdiL (CAAX protease family)